MNNVKYMHIRPPSKRGRAITVAYKIIPTVSGLIDIHLGVAFCSSKDNFCKATGRKIAEGRLHKQKPLKVIGGVPEAGLYTAECHIIHYLQDRLYRGDCPLEFAQNTIVTPGKGHSCLLRQL